MKLLLQTMNLKMKEKLETCLQTCQSKDNEHTNEMKAEIKYLDKGRAELNASQAFLLSLKYSSAACNAATAIPWDFSVFPSSRIKPW